MLLLLLGLWQGFLPCAQAQRPSTFTPAKDDPALICALQALRKTNEIGVSLAIPDTLAPGALLKSTFYPQFGGIKNVKSFRILPKSDSALHKNLYWWVKIDEAGNRPLQIKFVPPSKRRASPFVPAWTEKRAIEIAGAYRTALLSQGHLSFAEPVVTFEQQLNISFKPDIYLYAFWSVLWQRTTADGVPFSDDRISLYLSESHGMILYDNRCHTHFEEIEATTKTLKSKDLEAQAVKMAHKIADESPAFRKYYGEYTIDFTPTNAERVVIRPNDMLTCQDFHVIQESLTGALVWSFAFKLTPSSGKRTSAWLLIYLDALTGELRGAMA